MQFFDKVTVKCTSWAGGDWCVAARREKYIPYGWPAWGNWGKWWSIVLVGDKQLSTLAPLHATKHIKAVGGESGKIKEQYGKDAEDTLVRVPLGTLVHDLVSWEIVAHITQDGQQEILLAWWKGWVGNMHFSNSVTQYANFWLLGEPGQVKEFVCELQLLADVALLWFPSVGKTSLLNCVSSAAAKTAEYHFTTLIPNLGVVDRVKPPFVLIDIPGLIAGAAWGKWLGNEFLRHVMKARLWSFVFDLSAYEKWVTDMRGILEEVYAYVETVVFKDQQITQLLDITASWVFWHVRDATTNALLMHKQCVFVWNKVDLVNDAEIINALTHEVATMVIQFSKKKISVKKLLPSVFVVSAWSQVGIDQWLKYIRDTLTHTPIPEFMFDVQDNKDSVWVKRTRTQLDQLVVHDITEQKLSWLIEHDYLEEKEKKYVYVREIYHPEMSYLTYVLPWWNDEAELRYRRVLEKKQILKQLERAWVKKWDVFFIKSPYAWKEDRWIRWM